MKFYLEQIEVAYVLDRKVVPVTDPENTEYENKFNKDDRTCKGMLLHYMTNALLDIYRKYDSAKGNWDALDKKYGNDDAGSKHYTISKWLKCEVDDDRPIVD